MSKLNGRRLTLQLVSGLCILIGAGATHIIFRMTLGFQWSDVVICLIGIGFGGFVHTVLYHKLS